MEQMEVEWLMAEVAERLAATSRHPEYTAAREL